MQSGRTDLISDVELRRAITRYYAQKQTLEERRQSLPTDYRADIVGMLPTEYTDRVLRQCVWEPTMSRPFPNREGFAAVAACEVTPAEGVDVWLARIRELPDLERRVRRLAYEFSVFETQRAMSEDRLVSLRALLPPSDVPRDESLLP